MLLQFVIFVVVVFLAMFLYIGLKINAPPRCPPNTVRKGSPADASVLLCIGDSLTHGTLGGNWVDGLRARLLRSSSSTGRSTSPSSPSSSRVSSSSRRLVANAGKNGQQVWNIARRLESDLQCKPDLVVLLIGSNDVMAADRPDRAKMYKRSNKLPQIPTLEWSIEQLQELVPRIAGAVPRVALCTIPPLGDDARHPVCSLVEKYNKEIRRLAEMHNCVLLDVHGALLPLLSPAKKPYEGGLALIGKMILRGAGLHYIQGQSWDEITTRYGWGATFDGIHLSDRAAALVEELVAGFVEGSARAPLKQ